MQRNINALVPSFAPWLECVESIKHKETHNYVCSIGLLEKFLLDSFAVFAMVEAQVSPGQHGIDMP
jgi:hypothetical protein